MISGCVGVSSQDFKQCHSVTDLQFMHLLYFSGRAYKEKVRSYDLGIAIMTDLTLLQGFGQSFPEEFDGSLDSVSAALTGAFNRTGSLLAVGCNDGRLVIWDFLTRGIAKVITAHIHPISSVSWSRNGKK